MAQIRQIGRRGYGEGETENPTSYVGGNKAGVPFPDAPAGKIQKLTGILQMSEGPYGEGGSRSTTAADKRYSINGYQLYFDYGGQPHPSFVGKTVIAVGIANQPHEGFFYTMDMTLPESGSIPVLPAPIVQPYPIETRLVQHGVLTASSSFTTLFKSMPIWAWIIIIGLGIYIFFMHRKNARED